MKTYRERVIELARERGTGVTVDTLIDVLDERAGDDEEMETDLDSLTVDELIELAAERDVELPTEGSGANGAVLKADIIAAIEAAS